mmetsp:Transcript_30456/g.90247  ORF Transcript_30456/g.90247 Transcript_30456/m.90247 type:complete len:203 (-) Transcript_30456:118-726(-)
MAPQRTCRPRLPRPSSTTTTSCSRSISPAERSASQSWRLAKATVCAWRSSPSLSTSLRTFANSATSLAPTPAASSSRVTARWTRPSRRRRRRASASARRNWHPRCMPAWTSSRSGRTRPWGASTIRSTMCGLTRTVSPSCWSRASSVPSLRTQSLSAWPPSAKEMSSSRTPRSLRPFFAVLPQRPATAEQRPAMGRRRSLAV